jgi:hypothetical protein
MRRRLWLYRMLGAIPKLVEPANTTGRYDPDALNVTVTAVKIGPSDKQGVAKTRASGREYRD